MPDVFSVLVNPNRVSALVDELRRSLWQVGGEVGPVYREVPEAAPAVEFAFDFLLETRAQLRALETWYDSVEGAATAFWIPSYQRDLRLAVDTAAASDTVVIQRAGYVSHLFPFEARRHLGFVGYDGSVIHRRVTAAVDDGAGAGTETLTLDAVLTNGWLAGYGSGIVSVLRLVRLAEDPITIRHLRAGVAEVTLALRELPDEVPASV